MASDIKHGKHEECSRQFIHLSRTWYGETALRQRDYVDEITIGMYHPEGGTTGEFSIRWSIVCGERVPELRAFDDAWDALWEFRDVLESLKGLDNQNASPLRICELLVSCGVVDATPVESPYT